MRAVAWTILAIGTMLAVPRAEAQRYDPGYPVCLQTYSRGGGAMLCRYHSMAECRATAAGIAAQCLTNPYYGRSHGRRYRTY
jgi:hypothetical protein